MTFRVGSYFNLIILQINVEANVVNLQHIGLGGLRKCNIQESHSTQHCWHKRYYEDYNSHISNSYSPFRRSSLCSD